MELRSNSSVLRSNAPGKTDSPKGVLQVSSGNIGSSNLESSLGVAKGTAFDKYEADVPPLSTVPRCQSAQATLKLQRRKQRRVQDGESESLDTYPMYSQIITQAERLSPRYQTYREKQRKEFVKGSNQEQKWPDELEDVFQQALRVIPNWGRKKRWLDGKQSGRNEWITRYILIHTGVYRSRKQVSSHIQVLKPFLKDNPIWLKFVTDKDSSAEPGFRSSIDFQSPIITEEQLLMRQPLPPISILGSNVAPQAPCLRQIEFEMYVLDPQNNFVHTYTAMQSEIGSAPKLLEDLNTWQLAYPDLQLDCNEPQQNGEVVLFETGFRLMENHPTPGSKLGVDFFVAITRGMEFKDWKYKTRFYEKGVPVKFQENGYLPEDSHKANLVEGVTGPLKHSQIPQTTDARLEIAFRSSWWVTVFFNMTNKRLKVTEESNGNPNTMKQEEERASRYLQEMSVMQEVFATSRAGTSKPQRICTFLWAFRLARNGEIATTTWRELKLPVPEVKAESPAPASIASIYRPSMTLDTALRYTTCPQPSPVYAEYFDDNTNNLITENPESLLAAPLSESDSSSSTPTLNRPSFSTSTSYEASVSNSTLQPYTSQASAYHPQDFGYPPPDPITEPQEPLDRRDEYTFSSQDSSYISQDAMFDVQELGYDSPDLNDSSHQNLYYASQADSTYYSQEQTTNDYQEALYAAQQAHNDHVDCQVPIGGAEARDFNGGQIHLSFTEQPDDQPPLEYDSPYVVDSTANAAEQQHHQQLDHHQPLSYYHPNPQHQEYTHRHHQPHPPEPHQTHQNFQPFDPGPSLWPPMHFQPIEFADIPATDRLDDVPRALQRALYSDISSLAQQGHILGEVGEVGMGEGEGEGLRECPSLVEQQGGLGRGREVGELEGERMVF